MSNQDLFEQAVGIVREHGRKVINARDEWGVERVRWQEGREALADALLSELEIMRDLPYRVDVVEERRALLAHIREWLEGR